MDLYILDELLRPDSVKDNHISLIWTERFNSIGDFELKIKSTPETRRIFVPDVWLSIKQSKRAMIIETAQSSVSDEGYILVIKGRSAEKLLEDRVAKESFDDLTTSPKWLLAGTPGDIARYVFNQICVVGLLDPLDVIPFIATGNLFPADTIEEPSDEIVVELEPQTVSEVIENLCTTYELGYRLTLNQATSELYFNIYSGVDRTSLQSEVTPLLFSPELDNLQDTTEFVNAQDEKNVAYVFSNFGTAVVYADGVDSSVVGFKRKVLKVDVSEISEETLDVPFALNRIGKEALAKTKRQKMFDGEVAPLEGLTYGVDYNMGDVLELRNSDGVIAYKRVTEYIFTSDAEGDRAYPTLAQGWDTNAETWDSVLDTNVWNGYDLETWDDFG